VGTVDPMVEDREIVEKNLRKLYRVTIEALEKLGRALSEGSPIDLSADAALADHLRDTINGETLFFIAKWQPLGRELLHAEAMIKVSYDLFRIVRYANEIARTTRIAGGFKASPELLEVFEAAKDMVEKAFKSFIESDVELAGEVEKLDSQIDRAYIDSLKTVASAQQIPSVKALECIILRQLERMADHATYIAREARRVARE
jgi:phosphate transport system protein